MMRSIASLLLVGFAFPIACGGSNPPPKTEETAASSGSTASEAKKDDSTPPASSAQSGQEAPSAAPEPPAAPAASAAPDTTGDIKPPKADDPWMAAHQMPSGDVLKTIRPHQAKVQACFKAGKKRDPSVSGEVKIRFISTHDGKVRDWKDDASSMTDPQVTRCVGEAIKKLKFPKQKSPGDAWGTYNINFGP
jgi:hypothetical protein